MTVWIERPHGKGYEERQEMAWWTRKMNLELFLCTRSRGEGKEATSCTSPQVYLLIKNFNCTS